MAAKPLCVSRVCTKCMKAFPATLEFFFRCSVTKIGLKAQCKRCCVAYNKEWQRQEYRKNTDKVRIRNRLYRQENLEKCRAQGRARQVRYDRREYHRQWEEKNREHVRRGKRAIEHRRRARKRQSLGQHATSDVIHIYKEQEGRCFYCADRLEDVYEVDHYIPLRRGGSNDPSNIRIACPPCNRSKGYKMPWDWKPGRFQEEN